MDRRQFLRRSVGVMAAAWATPTELVEAVTAPTPAPPVAPSTVADGGFCSPVAMYDDLYGRPGFDGGTLDLGLELVAEGANDFTMFMEWIGLVQLQDWSTFRPGQV